MGFVLDGIRPDSYDRTYSDGALIRRIVPYFRPHRGAVALAVLAILLTAITAIALPALVAYAVDAVLQTPGQRLLLGIGVAVIGIGLFNWLTNTLQQYLVARVVADVVMAVRNDAFAAILRREQAFFDQQLSGKLVSRITSDTQSFGTVVTLTTNLLSQLLLVAIITGLLVVIEPRLALITLATAPLIVLAALAFRAAARRTSQQSQRATADVNATFQETLSGMSVAKSFRQEQALYADFRATNQVTYAARLRQGLIFDTIFPILDLLTGVGLALVIYFGGQYVLAGSISPGAWFLFVQSLTVFYFPLTSIASFWSQFQQGLAAGERIFALLDTDPVVRQSGQAAPRLRGAIRFEHVRFGYQPQQQVLTDLSLDIPAGTRLALVGHTGAGKTSIARLLARFYEYESGRILLDGIDLRELDLDAYRRQAGVVPQVPFLFAGTIADNLRYGNPDAGDAELEAAAMRIGDGAWLRALPNGLQTEVGERGGRLSLGQRQLVAFCRVLLQDPAILVLDEATASIDPFTETQIQSALDAVTSGRTSIIIAHRLATIKGADRIVVLDRGRIVESGDHDELLRQRGAYAELYATYFRHQSQQYIEQVGALWDTPPSATTT